MNRRIVPKGVDGKDARVVYPISFPFPLFLDIKRLAQEQGLKVSTYIKMELHQLVKKKKKLNGR